MVREETKQEDEKARVLLEVQHTEALRVQKQKEGISLANLIEERNKAEAIRAAADVSGASNRSVTTMMTMMQWKHRYVSTLFFQVKGEVLAVQSISRLSTARRKPSKMHSRSREVSFNAMRSPPSNLQAAAHKIKEVGQAEAAAILAKGEAEAKVRASFALEGLSPTIPPGDTRSWHYTDDGSAS